MAKTSISLCGPKKMTATSYFFTRCEKTFHDSKSTLVLRTCGYFFDPCT